MSDQTYGPQGLPICPKCGWQCVDIDLQRGYHAQECSAAAGARATRMAAAVTVESSVHDWGYGALAFKFRGGHTLVLNLVGGIRVTEVFMTRLSEERAIKLVNAIAAVFAE